jgi:hypothetical protein
MIYSWLSKVIRQEAVILFLPLKQLFNVQAVPKESLILEGIELTMLTGEPFHLKIPLKEC